MNSWIGPVPLGEGGDGRMSPMATGLTQVTDFSTRARRVPEKSSFEEAYCRLIYHQP